MKYRVTIPSFDINLTPIEETPPIVVPPIVEPPTEQPSNDLSYPFKKDSWIYKKGPYSVDPNSAAIVADLAAQSKDKASGGSATYFPNIAISNWSTPIIHVTKDIPKKTIVYSSNLGKSIQIRVPDNIFAAGGGDKHCAIFDWIDGNFVDMWKFDPATLKAIHGGAITGFQNSDGTFPNPMGARACGIAAQVGVITLDSLSKGVHNSVIAIATTYTSKTPKWPANRVDQGSNIAYSSIVRMGQIFRLPADYVVPSNWPPILKIIATAARDYGMVVIDTTGGANINMAYIEDPRALGKTSVQITDAYFGGLASWKICQMFPWSKLIALL